MKPRSSFWAVTFIFGNNLLKNRGQTQTTKSWNLETSQPGLPLGCQRCPFSTQTPHNHISLLHSEPWAQPWPQPGPAPAALPVQQEQEWNSSSGQGSQSLPGVPAPWSCCSPGFHPSLTSLTVAHCCCHPSAPAPAHTWNQGPTLSSKGSRTPKGGVEVSGYPGLKN